MAALSHTPARRREPTLSVFLFSPLVIDLEPDDFIDLSEDDWFEIPAHVAAAAMDREAL